MGNGDWKWQSSVRRILYLDPFKEQIQSSQWFRMCQFENSEKGSQRVPKIQNFNKINCFNDFVDIWPKFWAFFGFFGFFYL